jgi:NitT/TauT family transport system permease protein
MSIATLPIEEVEAMTVRALPARTRWSLALLRRLAIRLLSLAAFIMLWELASISKTRFVVNFAHVPAPTAVASAAIGFFESPKAVRHIASSVKRVTTGFALATLLAIPLGLLIGQARWAEDTLFTPLEILRPIPGVAWIPLAILMFATSEQSMIFICFVGAFFPILISTIHGVETLDRRLVYAAQSLGAKNWNILLEVVLPGTLPAIVTGLTIGTGSCWLLVVTAEMIAGQFGIGYFTWESYSLQKYPEIVLGMLVIGVLGMASSAAVRFAGNRLMPWHRYATHAR